MAIARSTSKLIQQNLKHSDGSNFECIMDRILKEKTTKEIPSKINQPLLIKLDTNLINRESA